MTNKFKIILKARFYLFFFSFGGDDLRVGYTLCNISYFIFYGKKLVLISKFENKSPVIGGIYITIEESDYEPPVRKPNKCLKFYFQRIDLGKNVEWIWQNRATPSSC